MVGVTGNPFGVATTADGKWSFVSQSASDTVAVFSDRGSRPKVVGEVPLPPGDYPAAESLTHDDRYLLVAYGTGAVVVSVSRAEHGSQPAVLGQLHPAAFGSQALDTAIEVAVSPDDRFVFVSLEGAKELAAFDFRRALAAGFKRSFLVGMIPVNFAPVGMAFSPDRRWLYATSEAKSLASPRGGTISVINLARAETQPRRSVVTSAAAGCDPVRVAVSPNGRVVWVTARESNSLLAFSASRLRTDPRHALLASVRVGAAPVGLAILNGGSRIVVADSNRFGAPGRAAELSVIDTHAALSHKPAVIGAIPAGAFPREMSVVSQRNWLLITNFGSNQLEVVDTSRLP